MTERLDEDVIYETKRIGEVNKEKTERRKQVNLDRERIKKGKSKKIVSEDCDEGRQGKNSDVKAKL